MKLVALCAVMLAGAIQLEPRDTILEGANYTVARVGDTVTGVIRSGNALYEIDQHGIMARPLESSRPQHDLAIASDVGVPPKRAAPAAGPVEIDVMFAYTDKVLEARTLDGIRGLAEVALAETNRACKDSGVAVRFRVAGLAPTTGTETGKEMTWIYESLRDRTDFLDAHTARANARADILVLLVDTVHGGLGMAPVMATPATAVAVVDHHESVLYLTIAHELGHIMGARHDVEDDSRDFPFPYGHGFVGKTSRTIMATPCARPERCPLVARWSAPPALGDAATADDARVLRETAATVAAFGDQLTP